MANPRFAWGIDVGNRALKAVKLVRDGSGGMRIDDVDVIEHEHILSDAGDNKEALVTAALNTFAIKHPEKGGAVAIGVSGQSSFARFIKLPPVEDKKLPEIVRFEAIQQIPCPLDDVEWSYQLFQDEGSPEKEVGIFAMRKELVNQHIKNFTDAGLNVQVVQMNPLAVYNAMYYDQQIAKGTTMIVDVGAENTDLIITEGEQVWLRSIPVGGNNFTEALVKQFKLKFPKAEDLKRNAATSKYTRQILQAMRPVFDNLVSEIQRSIGFYASVHRDSRIKQVIALGGTFRLPGLMKFLQMQLQLDVKRFDSLGASPPGDARLATLLNDNVLSSVGAYGLALQAMGEGKITSSLLPLQIRRERMWRDKTKWFAAAAALVVLGTGVAVGRYFYEDMQYKAAAANRGEIAREMGTAQQLATAWDEVEKSGAPEKTNIASLQALTKLREIWPRIVATVDKALPELNPADKAKKRNERQVVELEDMSSSYYEDLTPAVAKDATTGQFTMTQPEFINNASSPYTSGGGAGYHPAGRLSKVLTGMQPGAAPAPGADAAPAAGKQRGYLITLTATTPMEPGSERVSELVRNALLEQTKPNGQQKQDFRIERVDFVSRVPIRTAQAVNRQRTNQNTGNRRQQRYRPATPVPGAVAPANGLFGNPAAAAAARPNPNVRNGRPYPPGSALRPGVRPGLTPEDLANQSPEEQAQVHQMPALNFDMNNQALITPQYDPSHPAPIPDPVTGEDATTDNRLTFLVAVLLDPAPPAPPAPAPGTEGGGTEGGAPAATPAPPPAGQPSASIAH
jgi:type IV pilus assembly protein PilM